MKQDVKFPRMHLSLYVRDIEKTVAFYSRFFGQEPEKVKPDYAKFLLAEPALIISFVQNPERVSEHFGHLGIQVQTLQEVEAKLDAARKAGLEIREEIGTNCCYAKQDKFWVTDPDGVQWEVYYFHEDVAFNDPHYASEQASACCMPPQKEEKPKVKLNLSSLTTAASSTTCDPESGCC
jgi:catechol 2,3-dioxygenase-like lactoylglutathione lyase family enzyme